MLVIVGDHERMFRVSSEASKQTTMCVCRKIQSRLYLCRPLAGCRIETKKIDSSREWQRVVERRKEQSIERRVYRDLQQGVEQRQRKQIVVESNRKLQRAKKSRPYREECTNTYCEVQNKVRQRREKRAKKTEMRVEQKR